MDMKNAIRQALEAQARRSTPEGIERRRIRYNAIGGAMHIAAARAMETVGRDADDERKYAQEQQNGQGGTL